MHGMPISSVAPRGSVKDKVSVVISKEVVVGVAIDAGGETGRRTGAVTETGGIGTSEIKLGIDIASFSNPSPLLIVASDPRLFNVATEVVLSVLRCWSTMEEGLTVIVLEVFPISDGGMTVMSSIVRSPSPSRSRSSSGLGSGCLTSLFFFKTTFFFGSTGLFFTVGVGAFLGVPVVLLTLRTEDTVAVESFLSLTGEPAADLAPPLTLLAAEGERRDPPDAVLTDAGDVLVEPADVLREAAPGVNPLPLAVRYVLVVPLSSVRPVVEVVLAVEVVLVDNVERLDTGRVELVLTERREFDLLGVVGSGTGSLALDVEGTLDFRMVDAFDLTEAPPGELGLPGLAAEAEVFRLGVVDTLLAALATDALVISVFFRSTPVAVLLSEKRDDARVLVSPPSSPNLESGRSALLSLARTSSAILLAADTPPATVFTVETLLTLAGRLEEILARILLSLSTSTREVCGCAEDVRGECV